ncbi:MAG: DUF1573 domain-containing protein [Phycisphaerales bacterium]|nr:MAG: DUF1573 domain-containing protein [Phycisphaerales bacterium]
MANSSARRLWLLTFLFIGVVICAAGFSLVWSARNRWKSNKPRPKDPTSVSGAITCDQPLIDFGRRYRPVDTLEHVFKIRNVSQKKVKLRLGPVSCTCSTVDLAATDLAPGQETDLKTVWDLKGLKGNKLFNVSVQSTPRGLVTLAGRVNIVDYLVIDKSSIALGDVRPKQKITEKLVIQAPPGEFLSEKVSVLAPAQAPEFAVEVVSRTAKTMRVQVSVVGQPGKGIAEYPLVVNTHSPLQPRIEIPVFANHLEQFELRPAAVLFEHSSPELQTKWVTLVSHVDHAAVIERVVVDDPNMISAQTKFEGSDVKIGLQQNEHAKIDTVGRTGSVSVFLEGIKQPLLIRYVIL